MRGFYQNDNRINLWLLLKKGEWLNPFVRYCIFEELFVRKCKIFFLFLTLHWVVCLADECGSQDVPTMCNFKNAYAFTLHFIQFIIVATIKGTTGLITSTMVELEAKCKHFYGKSFCLQFGALSCNENYCITIKSGIISTNLTAFYWKTTHGFNTIPKIIQTELVSVWVMTFSMKEDLEKTRYSTNTEQKMLIFYHFELLTASLWGT